MKVSSSQSREHLSQLTVVYFTLTLTHSLTLSHSFFLQRVDWRLTEIEYEKNSFNLGCKETAATWLVSRHWERGWSETNASVNRKTGSNIYLTRRKLFFPLFHIELSREYFFMRRQSTHWARVIIDDLKCAQTAINLWHSRSLPPYSAWIATQVKFMPHEEYKGLEEMSGKII